MVEKCAICGTNLKPHVKTLKLSGGRDGVACSSACYNTYLVRLKNKPASSS
ncbi:MAG: hypothetical protein ACE5J2_02985 [Nitrososphaerales archaeon]